MEDESVPEEVTGLYPPVKRSGADNRENEVEDREDSLRDVVEENVRTVKTNRSVASVEGEESDWREDDHVQKRI